MEKECRRCKTCDRPLCEDHFGDYCNDICWEEYQPPEPTELEGK